MNGKRLLRNGLGIAGVLLLLGVTVAASGFNNLAGRPDCPGKVTCPLTGEEICQDRCPLIDSTRANCPGKVECPLTGELICRDKCPLGATADSGASAAAADLPPCCRGKK